MRLRTTLAAAQAAAVLALVTCAEPPTPTATDPIGLGADGSSALPSAGGEQAAAASQDECRIVSAYGTYHLIGNKQGRPHPDSVATVAVAEGGGAVTAPNVFWAGEGCPAGPLHLELDTVLGDAGTPNPEPGDFRLWSGTGYTNHGDGGEGQYWLMTYSPIVREGYGYLVDLELVHYSDGERYVLASREDWAGWADKDQDCWVYRNLEPWDPLRGFSQWRRPLLDSEACKLPLTLREFIIKEES